MSGESKTRISVCLEEKRDTVSWGEIVMTLKDMNKGAEFDTLRNRKPVKVVKQRRSMGKFGSL